MPHGHGTFDVKVMIIKYDMCKHLTNVKCLHIDSRCKLVDIGHPVIVIGFTECNGRFYVVALCISGQDVTSANTWSLSN